MKLDKEMTAKAAQLAKQSAVNYFFGTIDNINYFTQQVESIREALEEINTAPVYVVTDVIKWAAQSDVINTLDEKTRRKLYDVFDIALTLVKYRDELGILGSWFNDLDNSLTSQFAEQVRCN